MWGTLLAGSHHLVINGVTSMSTNFRTYDEFFLFYLRQHSQRANRVLHALGTALGLAIAMARCCCIIPGSRCYGSRSVTGLPGSGTCWWKATGRPPGATRGGR